MDEASAVLRRQAGQLKAKAQAIPSYGLWQLLRSVPERVDIIRASENLIGLSNGIHRGSSQHNEQRRAEIIEALGIDFTS